MSEISPELIVKDIQEQRHELESNGFKPCGIVVSPEAKKKLEEIRTRYNIGRSESHSGNMKIYDLRVYVIPELDGCSIRVLVEEEWRRV